MSAHRNNAIDAGRIEAAISDRTIALVGLMGAGKSTVGKRLADRLNRQFYDSDNEIEKAAGLSISDIFTLHGEAEFRRGERRVLERLLNEEPHVLATGGGAYLDPETRDLLREKAVTIWLNADLETLWRRVSRRGHRPLLKAENPKGVLSRLLTERTPIYEQADLVVRSEEGPHKATVESILRALDDWSKARHA
ncbi:shikimate kinase [Henriciella mobilis]|uniref:Shikimate kinase n=1 Tax=Henriciella mobilis TaxID=2305467 RepID=A0A399RI47_9PROT|nr:shikimate kinase [Henriciella mobilis]RIJ18041.1 shikimate kinase [Henriciella mobilis]RIJ25150.1 shikimate kinase [Henriciella mobilis]RIJ30213.1 shikimate kinase [Henriciella mobilis]